jgi:hypothetical protein
LEPVASRSSGRIGLGPALEQAAEGYARMMSGAARFRVVLTTGA